MTLSTFSTAHGSSRSTETCGVTVNNFTITLILRGDFLDPGRRVISNFYDPFHILVFTLLLILHRPRTYPGFPRSDGSEFEVHPSLDGIQLPCMDK